ncbi:MAG TPA: hypothetical protein VFV93_10455 [Thermomicrobiales bacterium]|nr:hypothetical protein [Thermomicrobiales bacterium]
MTLWKSSALIAFVLVLLLAGCGGDGRPDPTSTVKTTAEPGDPHVLEPMTTGRDIVAPDGRYSLRIPGEWVEYDDPFAELSFRTVAEDPALAINVNRDEIDESTRVQVYAEEARARISRTYRNVNSLSLTPVKIGSMEAYRWIYTAAVGTIEHLFYQVFLIDAGEGFVLTGSAPIDVDIDLVRPIFDGIAGSMTFARG